MALNHSPHILKVDTVTAFYSGTNIIAEIDVVLPEGMPLKQTHDIGESLQRKIESLSEIERCYVHLDYEHAHSKADEHTLKID